MPSLRSAILSVLSSKTAKIGRMFTGNDDYAG